MQICIALIVGLVVGFYVGMKFTVLGVHGLIKQGDLVKRTSATTYENPDIPGNPPNSRPQLPPDPPRQTWRWR